MKALVKKKAEPGLWMEEVPVPEVGPNDVLIRVRKAAICGTDIHIYGWDEWSQKTVPVPITVGHEFTGEVARLGSAVTGFTKGERVSAEGHITCGHCRNCRAGKRHLCRNTVGIGVHRDGAFAEFVAMPAVNVFKVPQGVPDEIAAFFDPMGNAVHTALSFDLTGEDVLITGAGPIGCMAAAMQPMGPAPVMSTSSPTRSNESAVCTAFPSGSKKAAISSGTPLGTLNTFTAGIATYSANAPLRCTPMPTVLRHRWR
ncbi:MAG TPA: alcohol dehydrogenase catalytic domain-containing protein, partial [Myxococcales bacterium]|nr:alcohol dehydrogenase catalytic domain-containing protein [Myxococcales bacterium]